MDLNEKLQMLLEKYSVEQKGTLQNDGTLVSGAKTLPLLPWRAQRRFVEFKNLAASENVKGISTMRTFRIVPKSEDLFAVLYREIDLCQFILQTKVTEVFAIGGDGALNVSALTEKGYVCTLELAATLNEGEEALDKHEIIAEKGVICDRAVDTQVPQSSIYVFGQDGNRTFTDVDAELFGLGMEECALVRSAFEVLKNGSDLSGDVAQLEKVVAAAKKSCETLENIIL